MNKRFLCAVLLLSRTVFSQNQALNDFFTKSYEEQKQYSPLNATSVGDNRYNDKLYAEFTDSFQAQTKARLEQNLAALLTFDKTTLSDNDKLSYEVYKYGIESQLDMLKIKSNRIPFNQFYAVPLTMAQYGSGSVVQPFKTTLDYANWLGRLAAFRAWADSSIAYFRKGMDEGIVLPRILTEKMIGQMNSFIVSDPSKSVFYGPVKNFPTSFTAEEKQLYTAQYEYFISNVVVPTYAKLADFLKNEYLPKTRNTHGLGQLPGGNEWYAANLKQITTTNLSAEQIHQIGLKEVARIRKEMEAVKKKVGFKGSLEAFFEDMRTNPKLYPYNTADEIVKAYAAIEDKIKPTLERLFKNKPKTAFEVRQTEAFRAASAAAQYNAGLADGSRPGIFYVPIIDPKSTPLRESLFIHEAIPGHHYQIMLQRENETLPDFRRYGGYTAYAEGWGLYTESLGKELGLYTDPYQYMKALGDEIHRAIRLVVDPGMHAKGWTREQAIKYMLDNEPITEPAATAEIERYMAIAGQATAYKVGSMKILELRARYQKLLKKKFNIADFHDQILKDGSLPLSILEDKMERWAKTVLAQK